MPTLPGGIAGTLGIDKWNIGLGSMTSVVIWFMISLFIFALIGAGIYIYFMKRSYCHRIIVFGMVGNNPMEKWKDNAKTVPVGRAGDRLFLLRRRKRYLPPPSIQGGINTWYFWEREDGELINIGIENVDLKQKAMGVKFVDTDMRMQRLGIEKNLQYRLQSETFWQKHGQMIINVTFYVIVTMMIIVLFNQFGKVSKDVSGVAASVSSYMDKATQVTGGTTIPSEDATGSGVIPAVVLLLLNRRRKKKQHGNS